MPSLKFLILTALICLLLIFSCWGDKHYELRVENFSSEAVP